MHITCIHTYHIRTYKYMYTTGPHTTYTHTICTYNMHTFVHAGTLNMHTTCTHTCTHMQYIKHTHTVYTHTTCILSHMQTNVHADHMHTYSIHLYYMHIQHTCSHTYKHNVCMHIHSSIRAWVFPSDTYRPLPGKAKVRNHKAPPYHTEAF